MHFASRVALDPAGDFGAGPQAAIGWRLIEGLLELGLLLWREHERTARIAVAAVAQTLGTRVIVAMSKGADPRRAGAGDFSDLCGRLALSEQLDDVPVASLHWVFGLAVMRLDSFDAQMSFYGDWLVHNMSIPPDLISPIGCTASRTSQTAVASIPRRGRLSGRRERRSISGFCC